MRMQQYSCVCVEKNADITKLRWVKECLIQYFAFYQNVTLFVYLYKQYSNEAYGKSGWKDELWKMITQQKEYKSLRMGSAEENSICNNLWKLMDQFHEIKMSLKAKVYLS